jgi:hypothetical protein|tara:strand:- start:118 stop:714 length:597 start_codon:yes stop_codon:yes gene_type:complete
MAKKSKWEVTMEEKGDEFVVTFNGKSNAAHHLLGLEALLRGLKSWGQDIDFKDGKTPSNFKKQWFLPNGKVKAKLNPGPAKKGKKGKAKVSQDAMQLYRQFNGTDVKSVDVVNMWLPDENSPLVALGEGECPFIGYESGKTNPDKSIDTYIHHFGEEGGKKPKLYVTMPPPGMKKMLIILGGDWDIEERGDGNLWLVD